MVVWVYDKNMPLQASAAGGGAPVWAWAIEMVVRMIVKMKREEEAIL